MMTTAENSTTTPRITPDQFPDQDRLADAGGDFAACVGDDQKNGKSVKQFHRDQSLM